MNLWNHCFSQNTNKKLSGFLPCVMRAEILTIYCSYFGRNDDFIYLFWNLLTFSEINWYQNELLCPMSYVHIWMEHEKRGRNHSVQLNVAKKVHSCPHLLPGLGFFSIMSSMNREFLSNFQSALAEMSVQPHFYHYHQNLLC